MKSLQCVPIIAMALCLLPAASGQDLDGPQVWMTTTLDQGAHPEGCGTSDYPFPMPKSDLLTGLGASRNLERFAATTFADSAAAFRAGTEALPPALVLVVTEGGSGSGTLIGRDGDILTRRHVVAGYADVGLVFAPARTKSAPGPGDIVRGRVIKVDEVADLALVRPARVPQGALSLAAAEAGVGAADVEILHGASDADIRAFLDRDGDRWLSGADKDSAYTKSKGAAATAPACEPKQVYQGRNADNTGLVAAYDAGCAGRVNLEIVVPDDKSRPIVLRADRNGDGKPDVVLLDYSRDGRWEISFWDVDYNGAWALVGHHPDGAIEPSTYESAQAVRTRLAAR